MGVVVTLKSRWQPVVLVAGEIVKVQDLDIFESSTNRPSCYSMAQPHQNTSALLLFKFPTLGKYDAILHLFMTTPPTMHVGAVNALYGIIMQ